MWKPKHVVYDAPRDGLVRFTAKDGVEFWLPDPKTSEYIVVQQPSMSLASIFEFDGLVSPEPSFRRRCFERKTCQLVLAELHGQDFITRWFEYAERGVTELKMTYDIEARRRAECHESIGLQKPKAPAVRRHA